MKGLQYALDLIDKSFGAGIKRAKKQTEGLDNAVEKANKNIGKIKSKGQKSFGGLAKYAKTAGLAIAAALSIGGVINFGNEVTNLTAKFEGYSNAIEFASGQDGGKNIQFLNDTIKDLNLDMQSSYKGFQTLTGSLKGTVLEGQATRDIFEAVGVASTVMNLSAEQSEGAFLALSQMASKGKVSAEELRGQLGERIPGALKIAADSMGMNQQAFNEMLDSGKIYAEDFLPKFSKQLKKTFEGGLPKAANSMQAAINRKNNALTSFKLKSGEAFRPLLTGILEVGTKVFAFASELMSHLDPVKNALFDVGNAFTPVKDAIDNMIAPFSQFSDSGSLAETVMNDIAQGIHIAMPLFQLLGSVLGTLLDYLGNNYQAMFEVTQGLYESGTAGEFLTNILSVLTYVWELLQPAINAVSGVVVEAIGYIGEMIGVVMEAVNALFEWGKKTEWVRRLLNAFASSVSAYFYHIRDVAKDALGAVGDLIVGVFTLDTDKIKSALNKGLSGVEKAMDSSKVFNTAIMDGWNKSLEEPVTKKIDLKTKIVNQKNNSTPANLIGNSNAGNNIVGSKTKPIKSKSKRSVAGSGGGSGNKHTVFNIQSFVKELTIQTTNLKENPRELKRLIEQMFNEAFADIQVRVDNA